MTTQFEASIYLDTRRAKSNGKYPVKLKVYIPEARTRKYYPTKFEFSKEEFKSIWKTVKPRREYKETISELKAIEASATEIAKSLGSFNFEDFERLMYHKTSKKRNVNFYYEKAIDKFKSKGSVSTSKNYETALKCLLRFHAKPTINFTDITETWLQKFETHCTESENKSVTTVSIYLRTLRTIFNDAIADKAISNDNYPFGKRKYTIPAPKGVKKALTPEQLSTLFKGSPNTPEQQKAKDFWFLSYLCNGINFKDILNLKCRDFDGDKFTFVRAKTAKSNSTTTTITVYLNDTTRSIIEKYGNLNQNPKDYVFPILTLDQNPEKQYTLVKNFTRMVNQNFLKYARSLGITEKISSYWARHSFATMAIRKGASMEYVGEAVGHSNPKTTKGYFAGFEDETKKEFALKLLEF